MSLFSIFEKTDDEYIAGLKSIKTKFTGYFDSIKRNRAMAQLEKELGAQLTLANSHLSKGIKKGDKSFVSLWESADSKIKTFCKEYDNFSYDDIVNQNPGLLDLKSYTEPDIQVSKPAKFFLLIASLIIIACTCGALAGIGTLVYRAFVR